VGGVADHAGEPRDGSLRFGFIEDQLGFLSELHGKTPNHLGVLASAGKLSAQPSSRVQRGAPAHRFRDATGRLEC
jgi:hypothetical protein